MRDRGDPALLDYLAAERAYYDAQSERLSALAATLAAEAAARFPDGPEDSVGWPLRGYVYRTRMPELSENLQFLRSRYGKSSGELGLHEKLAGSAEQLLLDENLIAGAGGFVDVGAREPSPDGTLLAWSADTSGAEIYQLRIRDLRSGADLPEVISRSYPGVAWSVAGDFLFYLVPDELNRPFQVWRHQVGSAPDTDALVYAEPDRRFELTLHASRSGELAVITAASRDTTEVRVIPLTDPLAGPVLVEPRRRGIEYRANHARAAGGSGTLYLVTNAGHPEFTLIRAPAADPGRCRWAPVSGPPIAPAGAGTRLLSCDVLARHLVLTVRRDGQPMLVITSHEGGGAREIGSSLPAGSIRVEHAEDYDRSSVIIAEESLTEPPAWYELDLDTARRTLLKRLEVPGYQPGRYRTERRSAPAGDGTPIPVTLAWRADVPLDGTAPCLLYGYGAYEDCSDPEFDRSLPSLLDRGVVYAIAHVRGGGECGRHWWQQGRLRAKPTTFTDFIAVADWLAGHDGPALVDGSRIVSRGLSAGGLLQGAVYSMRPRRWRAVVAEVPYVDCVTTMLDPSIPLTVNEWDEWGDPSDPADYACLRSYSPYDNPPAGPRPDLLVTGAVHDPRVGVHEPAKWVARLRATDTTGSRVLFRAELGAGAHTGPSGRHARQRYEAEVQAFILDAMASAGTPGTASHRPRIDTYPMAAGG
jgi:oligopeptidase B